MASLHEKVKVWDPKKKKYFFCERKIFISPRVTTDKKIDSRKNVQNKLLQGRCFHDWAPNEHHFLWKKVSNFKSIFLSTEAFSLHFSHSNSAQTKKHFLCLVSGFSY